jgi:hypothetical protein
MRPIQTCSLFRAVGLLAICGIAPVQAANILIVAGTNGLAQVAANVLDTELAGTNTVTVVNTGVPASLAGFTQIYDVRYNNAPAFTAGEMTQYLAFLNAAPGNTLFLMGENVGFNARNIPINQFIALAGGGTIAAPAVNSVATETVAPQFQTPNVITTVAFAACGLVTTSGTGVFASKEATGGCSLIFGTGSLANAPQGALVVVYDVNFIATAPTFSPAQNEIPFRLNLEHFVADPPAAPVTATPALSVWGEMILALGLCGFAIMAGRRRGFAT